MMKTFLPYIFLTFLIACGVGGQDDAASNGLNPISPVDFQVDNGDNNHHYTLQEGLIHYCSTGAQVTVPGGSELALTSTNMGVGSNVSACRVYCESVAWNSQYARLATEVMKVLERYLSSSEDLPIWVEHALHDCYENFL